MTDQLRDLLARLDDIAPDQRVLERARQQRLGETPPSSDRRRRPSHPIVVAVALAIALLGVGSLIWPWLGQRGVTTEPPTPSARVVTNGDIYVRLGTGDTPATWVRVKPDGSGRTVAFPASGTFVPDHLAFSPDGLHIATNLVGREGIWVASVDGSHPIQITHGANDAWPSWSPDGKQIVFGANATSGEPACASVVFEFRCSRDLFIVNADGSGLHQITDDNTVEVAPVWSPDGRSIAFVKNGKVAVLRLGGVERIVSPRHRGATVSPATWSPNSRSLIYAAFHRENWGIYAASLDGPEHVVISAAPNHGHVDNPVFAPDGSLVAFLHDGDLSVMKPGGSAQRVIVAFAGARAVVWRPLLEGGSLGAEEPLVGITSTNLPPIGLAIHASARQSTYLLVHALKGLYAIEILQGACPSEDAWRPATKELICPPNGRTWNRTGEILTDPSGSGSALPVHLAITTSDGRVLIVKSVADRRVIQRLWRP